MHWVIGTSENECESPDFNTSFFSTRLHEGHNNTSRLGIKEGI